MDVEKDTPLVMVVDDDADFCRTVEVVLAESGYRVACVLGPNDALQRIRGEKPDLVIADLMMEDLDAGFSLARRIKADPECRDTPVLIVTGIERQLGFDFKPRTPKELEAMGADDYATKPLSPDALVQRVNKLLVARKDGPT